jgi:hypothetical protein
MCDNLFNLLDYPTVQWTLAHWRDQEKGAREFFSFYDKVVYSFSNPKIKLLCDASSQSIPIGFCVVYFGTDLDLHFQPLCLRQSYRFVLVNLIARAHPFKKNTGGFEGKPYFSSFRLIGMKEIGLMLFYLSSLYVNDIRLIKLTITARFTVLIFTPIMIFFYGAGQEMWFGVIQDVLGALSTWYLLHLKPNMGRKRSALPISSRLPLQMMLCVSGIWESSYGLQLFLFPMQTSLIKSQCIFPSGYGIQSFGFMTILLGVYQICVSFLPKVDGLVFLSFVAHHLCFYYGSMLLLNRVEPNCTFQPSQIHRLVALALLAILACSR